MESIMKETIAMVLLAFAIAITIGVLMGSLFPVN